MSAETQEQPNMRYLLLVPAGLLLGTGIVLMYYAMGWEQSHLNQDLAHVGFSGLDNISLLWAADLGPPLIVAGLCLMVWLNSTAWKYTDGY